VRTYSIEAMMQDCKALQAGTSHNLGQNFAKAFDIQFLGRDNTRQLVHTTSWGSSTRMIGGLLMTHSDDDGLVLPPRIAPVQVVVVPLWQNDAEQAQVAPVAERVRAALAERLDPLRIKVDLRTDLRPAERFFSWVQQGVPLRVEVGPRDVKQGQVMLVRRDNRAKTPAPIERAGELAAQILETQQGELYQRALDFREAHSHRVDDYAEFKRIVEGEGGFVYAHWNGKPESEARIKEETKATIRCIPLDGAPEKGKCILTGEPSAQRVIFAQAY
jgi:prolyl-tRNA synthetase